MTAQELIELLEKFPPEKKVSIFWDGAVRGEVEGVVDDTEIVIVGEWSIYRDGTYRRYPEEKIVYG